MISRPESVTREMEQLVANKREHMINYAMVRGVKRREDAEDCITEAICLFFNKFDHTRDLVPVTYLYACSNGKILSWLRAQSGTTRSGHAKARVVSISDELEGVIDSDGGHSVAVLESRLSLQAKLKAIRQVLSGRERKVFELMLHGYNNKQVGQQLGICESRAYQHRKEIRKKALQCGVRS